MLQDLPVRPLRESRQFPEEGRLALQSTNIVVFMLASLFVIAVIAVLAIAKALIMPITAALVIGTMLSASATALEK